MGAAESTAVKEEKAAQRASAARQTERVRRGEMRPKMTIRFTHDPTPKAIAKVGSYGRHYWVALSISKAASAPWVYGLVCLAFQAAPLSLVDCATALSSYRLCLKSQPGHRQTLGLVVRSCTPPPRPSVCRHTHTIIEVGRPYKALIAMLGSERHSSLNNPGPTQRAR